ncbi:MAG: sigma-70 family RNA polymerase sigma factor [Endomicrobia bacterium]|nr:sigma-70 family RNA polymerase sigma factor [Endomicrobiia bacterium]
MLSDSELVRFSKDGRLEAFESLITKYKDRVYNIAFSFCANAAESDDIAQSVFVKAYANIGSFEEKAAFSTWLYRITVNECYTALKKRRTNVLSLDAEISNAEDISLADILADAKADIEKAMVSSETQNMMRKSITELPDKYRIILTLRDIEDMSYEEISRIMKISQDKVKVWLFRARNKLKQIIEKKERK